MKTVLAKLALVAACLAAFPGCITHDETIVRDVTRSRVEFESDVAARIFYETLSKMPASGSRQESKTEIDIPIILDHKSRVVSGPNATFNEAVAFCDSNKDGKITELEAKIFAEQKGKR